MKATTKKALHGAFEDLILRGGPTTAKGIVERLETHYRTGNLRVDKDRAAQYLIRNPNIIVLGDIPGEGIHVYGLAGVEYPNLDLKGVV